MQHKHNVSKAVKPCFVQLKRMLSVTLLFVTRNLSVPQIVCEHGGPGITPSSFPLSAVRGEPGWGLKNGGGGQSGGCGLDG